MQSLLASGNVGAQLALGQGTSDVSIQLYHLLIFACDYSPKVANRLFDNSDSWVNIKLLIRRP